MNFLAHLLLSCSEEELLVGNFLGDFVRNRDLPQLSAGIQRGVQLHRHIDTYTDQHAAVRQGTRLLQPAHRKYAGVILDIYFDFLLARHWAQFGPGSLREFTHRMYRVLEKYLPQCPPRVASFVPNMIADDWLMQYTHYPGLEETFRRLRRRVSQPDYFDDVVDTLRREEESLDGIFLAFFPDIIAEVQRFCAC